MSSNSNEGGLFWIGMFIAAVVAVSIPDRAITKRDIDTANTRCEKNDGVEKLRADYLAPAIVWCKDGAEFKLYPTVKNEKVHT